MQTTVAPKAPVPLSIMAFPAPTKPTDKKGDGTPAAGGDLSPGRSRALVVTAPPPDTAEEHFHLVHQDMAVQKKEDTIMLPRRTVEAIAQLVRDTGIGSHGHINMSADKLMTAWPSSQSDLAKKPQLMTLLDNYIRDHKLLLSRLVNPTPDTTGVLYADAVHHVAKKLAKHFPAYADAYMFFEETVDALVELSVVAVTAMQNERQARHDMGVQFEQYKNKKESEVARLEELLKNAKTTMDAANAVEDERLLLRAQNDEYAKKQSVLRTASEQLRMQRDEAQARIGVQKFRENMQNDKIRKLEDDLTQVTTMLSTAQHELAEKTKRLAIVEESLFKSERDFHKELAYLKKIAGQVDDLNLVIAGLRAEKEEAARSKQSQRKKKGIKLDIDAIKASPSAFADNNDGEEDDERSLSPSMSPTTTTVGAPITSAKLDKAKEAAQNSGQKTPRPNWSAFDALAKADGIKLEPTPGVNGTAPKIASITRVNAIIEAYSTLKGRFNDVYAIAAASVMEQAAVQTAPTNHAEYRQDVQAGTLANPFPPVQPPPLDDSEASLKKNNPIRTAGKKATKFLSAAISDEELAKYQAERRQSEPTQSQQLDSQAATARSALDAAAAPAGGSKHSRVSLDATAPGGPPRRKSQGGGGRKRSEVILQFAPVDLEVVSAPQHARALLLHLPATHVVMTKEEVVTYVNKIFDFVALRFRVFEKRQPLGSPLVAPPPPATSAGPANFGSPLSQVTRGETAVVGVDGQVVPLPTIPNSSSSAAQAFTLGGVDGVPGLLHGMDEASAMIYYRSPFFATSFAEDFRQCCEFVLGPLLTPAPPSVPLQLATGNGVPYGYNAGPQAAAASIVRSLLYYTQRMEATNPLIKFFLLHVDGVVPKTSFLHFRDEWRRLVDMFHNVDRTATGYVSVAEILQKLQVQFPHVRGQDLYVMETAIGSSTAKLGMVERSMWQEPASVTDRGMVLYRDWGSVQRLLHFEGALSSALLMSFVTNIVYNINAMRQALASVPIRGSELPLNTVMQALERADPDLSDTERRTFIAICLDVPLSSVNNRLKVQANKLNKRVADVFIRRATPLNTRDILFHKISPFANVPRIVLLDVEIKAPAPPGNGNEGGARGGRRRSTKTADV